MSWLREAEKRNKRKQTIGMALLALALVLVATGWTPLCIAGGLVALAACVQLTRWHLGMCRLENKLEAVVDKNMKELEAQRPSGNGEGP